MTVKNNGGKSRLIFFVYACVLIIGEENTEEKRIIINELIFPG